MADAGATAEAGLEVLNLLAIPERIWLDAVRTGKELFPDKAIDELTAADWKLLLQKLPDQTFAVHAHACTAAAAVWDPREPSAQRARQAATARGFEQCHQWARQPSRPAAAKAVWPSLSSDRTAARSARQRPRTVHYSRL